MFIVAGDQTPVIPVVLVDVFGSSGAVSPWHSGATGAKVGVTGVIKFNNTFSSFTTNVPSQAV